MPTHAPIGFFDSGIGGLSIWREVNQLLPLESTVYLADSANAPYGEKSKAQIIGFSRKNTDLLLCYGAKLIVVACNTATTNAISELRQQYSVPFIGIEPATKPAAISTQTGKIGILATKGTLASELFLNTSAQFRGEVEIIERVGTGLVQLIEAGNIEATKPLLERYLAPMIENGVDNIVLGCTHYPFLISTIRSMLPAHIKIIDSGAAVAKQTKRKLEEHGLLNLSNEKREHLFVTNTSQEILQGFLNRLGIHSEYATKVLDF